MIRHPSNGRRVNINLVDYMLGFTRVEDVRKVIQDVIPPCLAPYTCFALLTARLATREGRSRSRRY